MKLLPRGLCVLVLAGLALAPLPAKPPVDSHPQQSPSRPKPKWLKIIDQGQFDPRLKGYFTPEGVRVEIVADYPTVVNPVGLTFGDDGSLYVLEWKPFPGPSLLEHPETIRYKDGTTRTLTTLRKAVRDARGNITRVYRDAVKVLRDTQGKGAYDKAEVILEEELPSRILLHDGWLYVSGQGTVRRYRQSKPGGKYDVRETIARGFGGIGRRQVSGLTVGNDGRLYLTSGSGDNYVEGSDGSRATVLRTGAVFRCRPDGSKMEVYSIGYFNPYGDAAFDGTFNLFQVDTGDQDGGKFAGCRLMHVVEGSDFGWRMRAGAPRRPDPVRAAAFGELPGKMPPMLRTGPGAPAGLFIYNDTGFPENFRGLLYYPDPLRRSIRAYKVEPHGATFAVAEEFEFLKSDDPLFRPCQMVLGPDGAMYVCDRRIDADGVGRLWGDNKHGRIYRLRWADTGKKGGEDDDQAALPLRPLDSWAKIAKQSDEELLKTLTSEEFSFRQRAREELVRRGARNRPALLKLLADADQPLTGRVAALGALESLWNEEVAKACAALLDDPEAELRRLSADALALNCSPGDKAAHAALVEHLNDPEPAVRRAIALAVGRIGAPGAADALINEYKFVDAKDVYLADGLLRALESLGKRGILKLLDLANSGADQARDRAIQGFLGLRIAAAPPYLPQLLANPDLTVGQRAALVRSYSNYLLDPPVSLDPMVSFLLKNPKEDPRVKRAGLEVLSVSGPSKDPKVRAWLVSLLDQKDRMLQRGAVEVLGRQPAGARFVAGRFLAGKLPHDLRPEVAAALRRHAGKDAECARLLAEVMKGGKPSGKAR